MKQEDSLLFRVPVTYCPTQNVFVFVYKPNWIVTLLRIVVSIQLLLGIRDWQMQVLDSGWCRYLGRAGQHAALRESILSPRSPELINNLM